MLFQTITLKVENCIRSCQLFLKKFLQHDNCFFPQVTVDTIVFVLLQCLHK